MPGDLKNIRVVLADDHIQVHRIVETILQSTADIELIGQAANGKEALDLCAQESPDLVLMDVVMPVMDGIEATRLLHERHPNTRVLVISSFQDHESIIAMLKNGAVGYVIKTELAHDLLETIRITAQGKMVFSAEVMDQLTAPADAARGAAFHLSQRELEVLNLMATGMTMQEIADKLIISQPTVKYHIGNICSKLRVHSRSEALIVAAKNNLV